MANNTMVNSGGKLWVFSGGIANNATVSSGAGVDVFSGGTANSVEVQSGGYLYVSSGGTANSIMVSPWGKMRVSSGGTATVAFNPWQQESIYSDNGAIVTYLDPDAAFYYGNGDRGIVSKADTIESLDIESGLSVIVYSGGTATDITVISGACISFDVASNTYIKGSYDGSTFEMKDATISDYTVNAGGSITVSSGGKTNDITVNTLGRIFVSSGGTATDTKVSSGGSFIVSVGGKADTVIVSNGGRAFVSSGGEIDSLILSSGGMGYLYNMGTANNAVVNSSGYLHVFSGGTAICASVNSGGSVLVFSDGIAEKTVVDSYGQIHLSNGGTANSTTVNWGGNLFVSSGGSANQTIVESGRITILNGGYASNVILRARADRYEGDIYISAGGTVEDVVVEQYGDFYISSGGTVNSAVINAGGYLHISSGGTATSIKENGGYVDVQNGAEVTFVANTFSDTELIGGSATVHTGTVANKTTVISNSYLRVYEGGTANETTVGSDGYFYVHESGTVNSTTISSGGYFWVSSGATALRTMVNSGGVLYVSSGATATEVTAEVGGYLDFQVTSDTLITGTSGGAAFEIKNGTVSDNYTLASGRLELGTGVKADGITANSGGRLYVSSGATATSILENGGCVDIEDGAEVTFVKNTFIDLVLSSASATVHSGTTATNITASSGGRMRVYSDGIVDGVDVNGGGFLYVSSGGTATTIKENGGYVSAAEEAVVSFESANLKGLTLLDSASIHSNTRMTSTTVSRGGLFVFDGGVADTTMLLDGRTYVFSGGVANNMTVYSYASIEVSSGGTASDLDIKYRGLATVSEGGLLRGLNFSSGGSLYLRGGKMSGRIVIENGAYVSVNNSATIDFDISRIAPESDALINNLSLIRGSLLYTLTVGTQKSGSYMLAEGALRFNSTITVFNTDGVQLGTLTVGNSLKTEKATYSLVSFGESLSVDVETFAPTAPTATADITSSTTQPVTVTAVFGEDCTVREYSYDRKEWLAYTGPIEFTENGTVYFRGADVVGNMSEVTTITVDNIISAQMEAPVVSADVTTATNGMVTVTASFSESATTRQYSLDGKTWHDYTVPLTFKENGTAIFLCQDATGAFTCTSYAVNNIDTAVPTAPTGLQAVVSEQTVAFVWNTSTDESSGVKEYVVTYSLDGQDFTVRTSNTNYVLKDADFGSYSWTVQAVDFAGNESAVVAGDAFSISGFKPYTVEYSADNFEHTIRFTVTTPTLDAFRMPSGTYQLRVRQEGNSDWTDGDPIVAAELDGTPHLIKSNADGNADVFFANPIDTWESGYVAQHVGSINDWDGTNEYAAIYGKNKLADIIEGSDDANILLMTDDVNGDTLFVDDIYTASPGSIAEKQSRIAQINEIRAGTGDDIVDMTSQRFEYTGDGLTIRGGEGNDTIWANKGNNWLFGDAGDDRIVGASGNDVIAGGIGNDRMHGGGGNDVFTFCNNWGIDNVEQLATGSVTLWFTNGSLENWDAETMTYTDGGNSVRVSGIDAARITLKFGDDGSAQFAKLTSMGAFFDATTERIFEESGKGILASL